METRCILFTLMFHMMCLYVPNTKSNKQTPKCYNKCEHHASCNGNIKHEKLIKWHVSCQRAEMFTAKFHQVVDPEN